MATIQTQQPQNNDSIGDLFFAGDWDQDQQAQWNSEQPKIVEECFHQLFEHQARARPSAPAIDAWDGQLTYRELNESANRLAHHLASEHGVQAGDLVPVCFEKSVWHFISILAINKAGAAWVPLDPSHPATRRQQILTQIGAKLGLTSTTNADLFKGLIPNIIVVSSLLDDDLQGRTTAGKASSEAPSTNISPSHAAYVLFTSGSMGTPKGLVMEHRALCSSQTTAAQTMGLTHNVRMLQFAAFVFGFSVGEITAPLISGACLCVPLEHTRLNGLKEFVQDKRVNWAFLTPSFVRTMSPQDFPTLDLIVLGGEAVGRDVFERWFGHVRLLNIWGPAETCVYSSIHEWKTADESPLTIGRPLACHLWIVDPDNPDQLVTFGTVGEVMIQGPTILREYLDDVDRSRAAIITDLPHWATGKDQAHFGRFFRSGDLCHHNPDGTLEFVSRKDTQIKIRGQRVELGEVEHHIRTNLKAATEVVVEALETRNGTSLVAFFSSSSAASNPSATARDIFLPIERDLKTELAPLVGKLSVVLPSYKVPSLFIPCHYIPFITSNKLDRESLKALAGSLDEKSLAKYSLVNSEKRPPETSMEESLQLLWAQLLNIPAEYIGRDDSFLQVGGDSLVALHLVSAAREIGVSLTVKDVFDDPRLLAVASKAVEVEPVSVDEVEETVPFSLLEESVKQRVLTDEIRQMCQLTSDQTVEDAYPCTQLQAGLLAIATKDPKSYVAKHTHRLSPHVHLEKFKAAWQRTVDECANLRTRIVRLDGKTIQLVIRENVRWEPTDGHDLQSYFSSIRNTEMGYGQPLCQFAIVSEPDGSRSFVWMAHHSVCDGWSVALIMQTLDRAYHDDEMFALQPFSNFISYTMNIDSNTAGDYWRQQLQDASRAPFPPPAYPGLSSTRVAKMMKSSIDLGCFTDTSITKASILRAAWAIVLARHCDSDDVCFGSTISGRNAPVAGLDMMPGPAVATVPVRVKLDQSKAVSVILQDIQSQASNMVAFEQYGISNIASVSPEARDACDFSTLLVIQPMTMLTLDERREPLLLPVDSVENLDVEALQNYFTCPLVVDCLVYEESVELVLTYQADVVSGFLLEAITKQFQHVVQQLMAQADTPLGEVSVAGPWDTKKAMSWQKDDQRTCRECVHDLITERAKATPGQQALCTASKSMTYAELDKASTVLAKHLRRLGVRPGVIIPLCFEKSTEAVVSMLAIMKAGGAFNPFDPKYPAARMKQLSEELKAPFILVSSSTAAACIDLCPQMVEVSETLLLVLSQLDNESSPMLTRASPSDPAYVLFTSGSTGKPEGLIVHHTALCTAVMGYGRAWHLDETSRVLQFSNFVFDVSVTEILETLVFGGTVCIPSETERMEGLAKFVSKTKVNTAMLTSSFLRTIRPKDFPALKLVMLVGEAPTKDVLKTWHGHVKLINAYGSAESPIFCTSHCYSSSEESPTTIGKPYSGNVWIVDTEDHNRLALIGCVGEIVAHRQVARGYLNNAEKTKAAFIPRIGFLPRSSESDDRAFYKTGDLGRYNPDGSIEYLGRVNTQVKLRGYRIELGEIEYHIKEYMPGIEHATVELVQRDSRDVLIAFISFSDKSLPESTETHANSGTNLSLLDISHDMRQSLADIAQSLKSVLPPYMVPVIYLPLQSIPLVAAMKTDRRTLCTFAAGLSAETMANCSLAAREWAEPTTEKEFRLRHLWAKVLHKNADEISKYDSFLEIGGDSWGAIELVNKASKENIRLSVAEVFDHPQLDEMAALPSVIDELTAAAPDTITSIGSESVEVLKKSVREICDCDSIAAIRSVSLSRERGVRFTVKDVFDNPRLLAIAEKATLSDGASNAETPIAPFSLISSSQKDMVLSDSIRQQLDMANEQSVVEDAYPTTKLQEGLMAITTRQPGSYVAKYVYNIAKKVDIRRFREAWEHTVERCANLRTRIVLADGISLQVLAHDDVKWEESSSATLANFMASTKKIAMGYRSRLCRYALVEEEGNHHFVLVIHHAVIDGWCLGLVINTLFTAYMGLQVPELKPFSGFIHYARNIDDGLAQKFWALELDAASKATFPPPGTQSEGSAKIIDTKVSLTLPPNSAVTQATIVRAAWSITLARYCDTHDICFGTTVSGRNAPVAGLESMSGPMVATIPVRVKLNQAKSVPEFLLDVQNQASAAIPYEQFGLQRIAKLSPSAKEACDFTSLLVVQPSTRGGSMKEFEDNLMVAGHGHNYKAEEATEGYYSFPLVIQAGLEENHVNFVLIYNPNVVSESRMRAMSIHFDHVVQQLLAAEHSTSLKDISVAGAWDMEQALKWTVQDHPILRECVHDLISKRANESPDREAIFTSDGSMTYDELDKATERLANHLSGLGVQPEVMVPICFEKSLLAIVAMIGVLKAGGAFIPLDPSHPLSRRQAIVDEAGARIMVVSPNTAASCKGMTTTIVELSESLLSMASSGLHTPRIQPEPSNAAYVLFTSGSTGKPKAIVVDHSALASSIMGYGRVYHFEPEDRVLQFSAYVFDVSLSEILETLVFGGTVCVPSDRERLEDLSGYISKARVNVAELTSSFVRTLKPTDVPTLTKLLLVGEPPTRDVIHSWFNHARIINAYGPSEASIFCASHEYKSVDENPTTVGQAFSGACWIVEPDNHNLLAPFGCIGEILLMRHMARGYLNDEERSDRVFIKSVSWLDKAEKDTRTFHKTGDLARYNPDGTIEYLGRRDTQVKVRGHRVELGETEYHLKEAHDSIKHAVVDAMRHDSRDILVGFVSFASEDDEAALPPGSLLPLSEDRKKTLAGVVDSLMTILPGYMIPGIFLPLSSLPVNTSNKVDRLRLRAMAQDLSTAEQASYSLSSGDKIPPNTEMELKLRDLWSQIIQVDADTIAKNDSFLQVGGDSIGVIQLEGLAQQHGLNLSVATIFQHPRLDNMALAASEGDEHPTYDVGRFDLLPETKRQTIFDTVRSKCALVDESKIQDCYPCTPLQAGLIALGTRDVGSYVSKFIFRLPDYVDTSRFQVAWNNTVQRCDNLRTRIVLLDGSYFQAVVDEPCSWDETGSISLEDYLDAKSEIRVLDGSSLSRFALVRDEDNVRHFVWTAHHAIFDGWTNALVLGSLYNLYHGRAISPIQPYSRFINYTLRMNSDAAKSFWDTQLRNAQKTALPFRIKNASQKASSKVLRKSLDFSQHQQTSVTKASVLRAAWAIILGEYCDTKDVCFGSTVSGRNAPVAGLGEMSGPMIATIPIRTWLNGGKSTAAFLKDVQAQSMEMTPYEQFGLQNIAQLHSAAKQACDFESLLVIQHVGDEGAAPGDIVLIPASQDKASNGAGELFNYPLVIEGRVSSTAVELIITYHENVIAGKQAEAISHHFSHVTKQLLEQDSILLRDISVSGDWDLETAKEWNCEPSKTVKACLHDLISEQALKAPNKEAIFFPWESLSYKELDHVTDKFAKHLWELGVRRETKVPFCFEKSMWAIIAMIGIIKAGGAFVPIDPNYPSDRRRTLLEEVDSSYLVVSPSTAPSCRGMADNMIELSPRFIRKLPTTDSDNIPDEDKPRPDDAVYTLFTSGSTGKPKGIVMEHSGMCISLQSQVKTFGITHQTRYLQFASYTFDASISEIFSTLIAGGTVCVPDESQRLQHITTFIKDVKVNMALLTPSFVRTFSPDQVPSLQTLIVGGEAPGADTLSIWQNRVRLINAYGPAETCIACASHVFTSQDDSPRTIGRNLVGANWIVSPESHNRLMPIGCVGELLVQGPALAREYMNDKAKTDSAFIHSVTWLCPTPGEPQRFYKTGDLVRYLPNGDLEYIGRNDSQIKLRGQRIELAEIESAIKEADSIVEHVAVEKIKTGTGDYLVASITWANKDDSTTTESSVLTVDENMKPPIARIVDSIKLTLPPYMVPSYFLPLSSMPFGSSMKLDRNKIKTMMNSLSQEELGHYSVASTRERVEPTTEMEFKLRDVWAEVLAIPVQDIGKTDGFFEIGGDSISAIHVVSLAQQHGIAVTVPQIFAHPELSQLADKATLSDQENPYETTPFSIMDPSQVDTVVTSASDQCQLAADEVIEDIYPCTPLQAGLLALAVKEPGSYISHYIYRLADSVDVSKFIKAWDATVAVCGNLRTRIITKDGVHLQTLIKGGPSWLQTMKGETASNFIRRISTDTRMTYGDRLCQYALLTDGANDRYFYLAMHHAIFDGFSNAVALTTLQNIYRGAHISSLEPFSDFIKYTREMDHDDAKNYWMDQLRGATRASFPRSSDTTSDLTKPRQSRVLQRTMNLVDSSDKTITQATLLRAAWALLLARYSDTSDICFGATVSGRNAPVAGLASMPGPMIATVPVRVRLHDHMGVAEYLRAMQDQTAEMVAFEQFGLQNIAKLNEETRDACSFSSLLVVQPGRRSTASTEENILTPVTPRLSMPELPGGDDDDAVASSSHFNYPLVLECTVSEGRVTAAFTYYSDVLESAEVTALSHQFEHVARSLLSNHQGKLSEVSIAGPWDLATVSSFNSETTQTVEECLDNLISKQALKTPHHEALYSTDKAMTYSELDSLTSQLARHLTSLGVRTETVIPICFEKSVFAVVAMIAILKAGGVFVPLDPSHPESRHQALLEQLSPEFIIISSSATYKSLYAKTVRNVVTLSESLLSELPSLPSVGASVSRTRTRAAAYILFTSGSTGQPKGIIIEHAGISTSLLSQCSKFGINESTRYLQFTSYSFDASISEIFSTLIRGGTVCIPSDAERLQSTGSFINQARVNTALLTPSLAKTIDPRQVPTMKTLILGGEAATKDTVQQWQPAVTLINAYGLTEVCIACTSNVYSSSNDTPNIIGRNLVGPTWVVDPGKDSLTPVGCIGELVVQGDTLARGYLNDSTKTDKAFINRLECVPTSSNSHTNRFYRTGDLVRYKPDGRLEYVGRQDSQLKLRGQRLELSEIEYSIQQAVPELAHAAVDLVSLANGDALVAFLSLRKTSDSGTQFGNEASSSLLLKLEGHLREMVDNLGEHLTSTLPSYMVPSFFIPVQYMPFMSSMKLDRKMLKKLATSLSSDSLLTYSLSKAEKVQPQTEIELKLQAIWAQVLGLQAEEISRDDRFLQIGGDSISAVHLVSAAHEQGLELTVPQIFKDSRLFILASQVRIVDEVISDEQNSEMIPRDELDSTLDNICQQCDLSSGEEIENIYPCTSLQEGLTALSEKQPGSYDSTSAIQLVTKARESGIETTVKQIFDDPRLCEITLKAKANIDIEEQLQAPEPFSLLEDKQTRQDIHGTLFRNRCGLSIKQEIEDAYPCTPLQGGLLALAEKRPGSYTAKYVYRLGHRIDVARFKLAWEQTVAACANLRTRIAFIGDKLVQAIIKDDSVWEQETPGITLSRAVAAMSDTKFGYGTRLARFSIITDSTGSYFLWTIHHAIFDGWTMGLVMYTLNSHYHGLEAPTLQPYSIFINHMLGIDSDAASNFWAAQLSGAKKASFPQEASPSAGKTETISRSLSHEIKFASSNKTSVTTASILRTAWALLLSRYSETDDVCFGAVVSGRQAPVKGLETMAGAMVATAPVRIKVEAQQAVSQLLADVQNQAMAIGEYEQYGLQKIVKLSPEAKEACDFTSLFVVQPSQKQAEENNAEQAILVPAFSDKQAFDDTMTGYFSYPLVFEVNLHATSSGITIFYHANVLSELQVQGLAHQFENIVQQLLLGEPKSVSDLSVSGPWDLEQIIQWNQSGGSGAVYTCLYELISIRARRNPDQEAIYSSGGSMTYGELDDITTRFANHLSRLGVRPEHMVPFCLEKSRLPIIAMIGIMKAGGIFVPLDPAHPANRRRDIVRDINAQLIIASPSTRATCVNMASKVVVLSDSLLSELRGKTTYNSTSLKPMHHNAAYMLFTSGITGKPKGIVVEHAAICTSLLAQGKFFGLSEKTRYLQFASYVFDASISEVFSTLLYGGTVCVPSDTERLQQTAKFITAAKVNTALLTPSIVRTLSPAQVPTLTTLIVGGEAPAKDTLRIWQPSVKLINAYGPTEACIACAAHIFESMDESPTIIGQNFAGPNWIVEPDNHNKLTPVGCVGELLVQGHALARGYLNDRQKTDAAFIDNVSWLPEALEKNKSRFYKTGDLVRYKAPGILEYVGRRDSQLKLRGQRMEVAEVEYAIKSVAEDVEHVAVELVSTDSGDALVALITFREKSSETMRKNSSRHLDMTGKLKQTISERVEALRQVLPQYMVPTYFIPLADMPFVSSMKVDRKELQRLVSTLTPESLLTYSLNSGEKIEPTTDMEARMRDLWAQVLRVNPDTIGTNDSFLQIGGDSITAIQLVSLAQESGIGLTVADVFADSRLSHLASVATADDAVRSYNPEPFDLVQSEAVEAVLVGVDDSSSLPHMQMIEDIYPCTSLQEGLLSLSVRQPGSYIGKFIYRLSPNADIPRFKRAWERTVELCGSLRTFIVLAGQHTYQAILKSSGCHWDMKEDGLTITDYLESLRSIKMQYGTPLTRYALVGNSTEGYYFALAIHHAVLDGWSHDLVMSMLRSLYAGQDFNIPPSYAGFIQYTQNIDKSTATNFWRGQLLGARRATFPPSPPPAASAGPTGVFTTDINFPDMAGMSITKATILRAAWAVVIARYCDSDDVCFGATVSGRNAAVHRLGEMVGPVFATVPVRVCLNSESTVLDFLQRIQKQASDMIDFEQFGLQNIAKIDQAAKEACDFTSLLVIQPVQGVEDVDTSSSDPLFDSNWVPQDFLQDSLQQYFTYPLVTDCFMYKNRVGLQFTYRSDLLSYDLLEGLAEQFRHVVGQLAQPDDRLLKQVSVAGPWDLAKAKDMNKEEHPVLPVRIHQLITHRANRIPDKQAIYTSGGTMTYAHLNKTCNALAAHLTTLGVGAEIMVPFCFEKSMWAVVAMLSIMKAGGVFVPLDPSHPRSRREDVVRETGANVMLVSPKTKSSCTGLTSHIIELTPDFIAQLHKETIAQTEVKKVAPSNAAYVLFTSGSIAKPKAIVVDHAALSMSIMGYDRVYSLDKTSRVLQFSNYVFDVSLSEILETLTFGGTVCIPTDEERMQGLHTFISSANVNTAMLTPSYLRTVDPKTVPSIQRLLLVGEPAAKDTLETWVGRTEVINAYGPSESSIFCTSHLYTSPAETPTNIGRAFSGACWIVEPGNPSQLAPIGCVGEILLQRRMARGYLNDPKLTKEVFIDSVPWLKKKSRDSRKFLLTGDLGRFNQDGTIEYLGRRDTQVKVHGYRIELGEIEYRIKSSMSNIHQVAVDVIRQDSRESLAAFISFKDKSVGSPREGSDTPLMRIDDQLRDSFSALADELRQALPSYMVPGLLIPLLEIPANTSLKIDRPALRRLADVLTSSVLSEYTLASHHKTSPVNDSERQLQSMWAKVLGVDPETIGRNDSFLRVGGDSIAAIRLTTIAQQQGLQLTVPMVFESPRLCDMALKTSSITESMEYNAEPFSLVPSSEADILKSTIRARCHLRVDQEIEDIYPCTGGQEFYMKSAIERPGSYTAKRIYKLSSHVDIARFRSAFAQVMNTYTLMRTRIISHQGRSVQAVISNDVSWDDEIMELTSVESYLSSMEQNTMGYDNKLCRYAIIRNGNDIYLIWVLHHSIFDGRSTGILLTALHLAYSDVAIPAVVPYNRFIKYVYSRDDEVSKEFWLSKLSGAKRCQFPSLPASTTSDAKNITCFATHDIQLPSNHIKSSPATVATVVRAAWAMMLGKRGNTQDVTFSETISGRQAPVMGLSNIAGPVLARVPMRVRLNAGQTPSQLLDTLQAQAAEMVAHEQYGISKIAKLTPEIADACNFSSHLIIQPAEIVGSAGTPQEGVQPLLKAESADYNSLDGCYSYPLVTHALVGSESIKLYFIYQEPVLTEEILSAVYDDIKQFVHTLYQ